MFELAPYACTVSDIDGRYLKVNQAFCRAMKLSAEAAIGRTPWELGIVVDEAAHARASAELARTGVTRPSPP